MNKYEAHFNGGPSHGDVKLTPTVQDIYTMIKAYDSGLCTESKYCLVKVEGLVIYYDLIEEKFIKHIDCFKRDSK